VTAVPPLIGGPGVGTPDGERPAKRRWSLRARLITLVLLVATVALTVVDILIPTVVRSQLLDARDASLNAVINSVPVASSQYLQRLSDTSPLKGGLGWTVVNADGVAKVVAATFDDNAGPRLPAELGTEAQSAHGPAGTYRLMARKLAFSDGETGYLVVWTDADDINDTIQKVILRELVIAAGLLLLLGVASSLLIRRQLKPLEDMATVADSIAAGDLSRRVDGAGAGAEVDRLGRAFNGMLDGINGLLAERQDAEQRLRQFVADASHELRTPVAAVRGYTDLYHAGALPEDAAVGRAMERMGFEARRMGSLVDDLLTLAQADDAGTLSRDRLDLGELLAGVVEDAAAIDAERNWTMTPPAGPVTVLGDPNRLHQLFANLLANVRAHTPTGTTASVSTGVTSGYVDITVADDGPGVDPATLPLLFHRFYRADPARSRAQGGSGLGLSIVAAIASAHGGSVTAESAIPHGLRVTVRLPVAPDREPGQV
jgi:two-component system, OmpR family, sensor kinase